jgi:hypothetical protein
LISIQKKCVLRRSARVIFIAAANEQTKITSRSAAADETMLFTPRVA